MDRFESPLVLYINGKLDLVSTCNAIRAWASEQPEAERKEAERYLGGLYDSHQIGEHVQKKLLRALYQDQRQRPDLEEDGEETVFKQPKNISEDATVTSVPDKAEDDDATRVAPGPGDDDETMIAPDLPGEDEPTVVAGQPPGEATRMISEISADLDRKEAERAASELGPGSVLKGRFNLVSVLGEGGMGRVYKAIDMLKVEAKDSNPYVAIKLLAGDFKEHPDAFIALQRETSKAQKLAHPNISTVYDFDRHEETVYMTMELLEGTPLDTFIKSMPRDGLDIEQALGIIQELGAGLAYAHSQGLVHSDFKPGNAFLLDDGSVKVIDFGIARAAATGQDSDARDGPTSATSPAYATARDDSGQPVLGDTTGNTSTTTDDVFDAGTLGALTPAYATSEMFEGKAPHPSDDIYALACVAVQLLTGRHPYNKKSAPKARDAGLKPPVIPGLTSRQQRALEKALAFRREDRTENMEEFLDGIRKRKSYFKQIALGSIVTIALVTALGYQPVMNYYEQKELDELIASTNSGSDSFVRSTLASLQSFPVDKQLSITTGIRDRALSIFIGEIHEAVDFDQDRYDFERADSVIREALTYYPDSAAIKELDADIRSRRAQAVAELEQEFYTHLVKRRFLPTDERDMADVLEMLAVLDADNSVLEDPRLEFGYYKGATDSLKAGDTATALVYAGIGKRLIPVSTLFANLEDGLFIDRLRAQAVERISEIALPTDPEDLQAYATMTAELALLSLFEPAKPPKHADFLALAAQAEPAALQDFIPALPFQQAAGLAQNPDPLPQDSLPALDVLGSDTDVDALVTTAGEIRYNLARFGNAALAQYNVDYPVLIKRLAGQRRHALIGFYNDIYRGLLLDETVEAAQQAAQEAATRYRDYLAGLTLRADEENDKRIFRKISAENRLNDSIQVYQKLSQHSKDEEFLEYARAQISRMYLTLAENSANESEFERALNYAENAQKYVNDERTLEMIEDYRKEITIELLPALVVSGDEELKQQARKQLRYLKKNFPDEYPFFINRIAAVINEDIIILASENILDAHKLKEHALEIVNSRIIRNVAIKPLPEPSKLALQGKIEVSQHKLTAAQDTYAKARAETPGHYQVAELDELLQAELETAREHFSAYRKAYGNEQYDAADEALSRAQQAWTDNSEWLDERSHYDRILAQVRAEALLCREDIQGLGKQSRGICRDKLLVSKRDAPTMVVIPAATTRDEPYAISKYETSTAELNLFCAISGSCEENTSGDDQLPARQVPIEMITAYANWLSAETGFRYTLADKPRWINAASAGGREGNTNYNCRLRLGTKMIKGQNIVPVTSGTANNWGLVNYVGNADELVTVTDGYQLVGGNFSDSISDCKIGLSKPLEGNYELAGFRMVRELQ